MEHITFNNEKIEYELIRKNVKNINLRIYADGRIAVSANSSVPAETVSSFVLKNAERIIKAREKFKSIPKEETDVTKMHAVKILGKDYSVCIIHSSTPRCSLVDDKLVLSCSSVENANEVYYDFLHSAAETVFFAVLGELFPLFKSYCRELPELRIKKLKSQWGSCRCKENVITLNLKLIHYDKDVIKFVVMHEYCHFIEPNHSKCFYNALEKFLPEWKEYNKILKNK